MAAIAQKFPIVSDLHSKPITNNGHFVDDPEKRLEMGNAPAVPAKSFNPISVQVLVSVSCSNGTPVIT
jgi:hypothetical protein